MCSALSSVEYTPPPSPETTCVSCNDVANPCALLRAEVAQLRGEVRALRRPNDAGTLASSVTAPMESQDTDWLDAKEATAFLKLPTPKALYAAVRRLEVPAMRLGNRRLRFSRAQLAGLLR
jgi:hypothetical protein